MNTTATLAACSEPRKNLLKLMQRINFGRIEGLEIKDGEPVLDPPPDVVYEVKFGGENGPRKEHSARDFKLKVQVRELFMYFDRIGFGKIDTMTIKHGVPFKGDFKDLGYASCPPREFNILATGRPRRGSRCGCNGNRPIRFPRLNC